MTNQINEENIRVAAYYIWEQAGRPEGAEKECWIKACEQLFSASKSAPKKSAKSASKKVAKSAVKSVKKVAKKSSSRPAVKAEPFYGIRK